MFEFAFVITIFFMLLGPFKLIPTFAGLTRGMDLKLKRDTAVLGTLLASVLCAIVTLTGVMILDKYRISLDAVRIAGGLVLLIAGLQGIFQKAQAPGTSPGPARTAIQLALSPVAVPFIVSPAGIGAILIFMMLAPLYQGMALTVVICLTIMMVLNFLVMYFIDQVMKTPGIMIILTVLGSILVFVQVSLAIQMIVNAFQSLGVFKV